MATAKHAHKYRRHRYKTGNIVFFCALPDCSVKVTPALTLGKKAVCWRCEKEFIMNDYSIRLARPHCDACHNPKLKDILPEVPTHQVTDVDMQARSIEITPIPIETPANTITTSLRDRLSVATQPDEDI